MKSSAFSIKEAIKFGITTVIDHFAFYLKLFLIYCSAAAIVGLIGVALLYLSIGHDYAMLLIKSAIFSKQTLYEVFKKVIAERGSGSIYAAFGIFLIIFTICLELFAMGFTKVALDFYDYDKSSLKSFFLAFSDFQLAIRYVCGFFLYVLLFLGGLILLIIPGLYFAIKFGCAPALIIDQRLSIAEAFAQSAEITKGVRMKLLGLLFILVAIELIIGASQFASSFLNLTMSTLIYVYVYRKLSGRK